METAVIIEKEIKHLNSYEKIDQFIKFCGFSPGKISNVGFFFILRGQKETSVLKKYF